MVVVNSATIKATRYRTGRQDHDKIKGGLGIIQTLDLGLAVRLQFVLFCGANKYICDHVGLMTLW